MSLQGEELIFFDEWLVMKYISIICRRLSRDARWAYSFMLVHKENVNAYTMLARTEDEKNKWIEAIKEAYNNEVPPQSFSSPHEPVMTTFDKPTVCSYCNKMLKGLFYQGIFRCDSISTVYPDMSVIISDQAQAKIQIHNPSPEILSS